MRLPVAVARGALDDRIIRGQPAEQPDRRNDSKVHHRHHDRSRHERDRARQGHPCAFTRRETSRYQDAGYCQGEADAAQQHGRVWTAAPQRDRRKCQEGRSKRETESPALNGRQVPSALGGLVRRSRTPVEEKRSEYEESKSMRMKHRPASAGVQDDGLASHVEMCDEYTAAGQSLA